MKQLKNLQANKSIDKSFILKKCNELLKEANITKAPIEPEILASFRDIRVVESQMAEAGILYPFKEGGAEIQLRKADSTERKRFTCCHEITHTFCPDWQLNPQKRIDKETGVYKKSNGIEYLCDFGASELLMPSFLFSPRLAQLGFSIDSLLILSDEFESSLEATAIKMVRCDPRYTAVVLWEEKYKPTQKFIDKISTLPGLEKYKPKRKFRVKFGFGFEGLGYIPKDKSLDETKNIIQRSFDENKKLSGLEGLNFGSFSLECKVYSLPLGPEGEKKVLSLLSL